MEKIYLTPQQMNFIDTFGYLVFPGLLKDKIADITAAFEEVWVGRGGGHNGKPHEGTARSVIVPFIDQSDYLSTLLDDPHINGIFSSLLGDDFTYVGSDGNYYVGDTRWHSDLDWEGGSLGTPVLKYFKIAFYLDPLTSDSGALRVIPGSHRFGDSFAEGLQKQARNPEENWGISGRDVPAIVLETQPGDVALFNFATKHSSWGGGTRRRMFTMNCCSRFQPDQMGYLKTVVNHAARFWLDEFYGPAMIRTASPERMVHLQQILDNQSHLPEETRKAKSTMTEPARG